MRNYDKKRVTTVIRLIHNLFEHRRKIPSAEAKASLPGCPMTITRARNALLIHVKKIGSTWTWMKPRRTLEEALAYASRGSRNPSSNRFKIRRDYNDSYKRSALAILPEFMKLEGYLVPSEKCWEYLRICACPRKGHYITEVKEQLGIKHTQLDGVAYWVYVPQEIEDWLSDIVTQPEPVAAATIYQQAKEQHHCPQLVIDRARYHLGTVIVTQVDGVEYWHDPVNS